LNTDLLSKEEQTKSVNPSRSAEIIIPAEKSDSLMDLDGLIKAYPPVTSVKNLEVMVANELKNPFDMSSREDNKLVILPKNYQELYKSNYLFTLFLNIIHDQKYTIQTCDKEYNTRLKLTPQNDVFLKSFGICALTREIPVIPSQKGMIWKGIASAVRLYLVAQPKLDISLFKVKEAVHPATQLFGDIWGQSYPIEKKLLDYIIHSIRVNTKPSGLLQYLIPLDQLSANKGLHVEFDSDVITEVEKSYIIAILRTLEINPIHRIELLKLSNDLNGIQSLEEEILERQKSIKYIKDIIKSIISDRVTACFSPYEGKARDKARKIPIKELQRNLEGNDKFRAFNPSRWFSVMKITPLPSFKTDLSKNENLLLQIKNFQGSLSHAGIPDDVVASIYQEYQIFLTKL
jgi:hypothetical protein